jgi:hypothetical protein
MASEPDNRRPLRRTIRGGRPFFFPDPAIDKVLNMTITLASEVWALRERLTAMEAVQIRQGALSPGEIDDYEFTAEQEQRLGAERREFIANLFRVLQEQVQAAAEKSAAARAHVSGKPAVFGARISRLAARGKGKARPKQTTGRRSVTKPARAASAGPARRTRVAVARSGGSGRRRR